MLTVGDHYRHRRCWHVPRSSRRYRFATKEGHVNFALSLRTGLAGEAASLDEARAMRGVRLGGRPRARCAHVPILMNTTFAHISVMDMDWQIRRQHLLPPITGEISADCRSGIALVLMPWLEVRTSRYCHCSSVTFQAFLIVATRWSGNALSYPAPSSDGIWRVSRCLVGTAHRDCQIGCTGSLRLNQYGWQSAGTIALLFSSAADFRAIWEVPASRSGLDENRSRDPIREPLIRSRSRWASCR